MFEINLMPESARKANPTPLPQFASYLVGILVVAGLLFFVAKYHLTIIPTLEQQKKAMEIEKRRLTEKVAELKAYREEIERLSGHVDAVKALYKGRIIWAKLLSDIKNIVNADKTMSSFNSEMRYLWLSRISGTAGMAGKPNKLEMDALATANTRIEAIKMAENLLAGLRTYAPTMLPEKKEEEILDAELKIAIAEHDAARKDNPTLPAQGEQEQDIRRRMKELLKFKSGGIALKPFHTFINVGSLGFSDLVWTALTKPRRTAVIEQLLKLSEYKNNTEAEREELARKIEQQRLLEDSLFPPAAWKFKVSVDLLPGAQ